MAGRSVDPAIRDAAEALMRDSNLPVLAIAARTRAESSTIRCWNRRFGRCPSPRPKRSPRYKSTAIDSR